MHNGKALLGAANGNYKHGVYSEVLGGKRAKRYEARRDDPDLLNMRDDITILEGRIAEVLARYPEGETGALYLALKERMVALREHQLNGDTARMSKELDRIEGLIQQGVNETLAWKEVADLAESKRKLIESEQKRVVAARNVITEDRMEVMVGRILLIVSEEITDRDVLQRVGLRFRALLHEMKE